MEERTIPKSHPRYESLITREKIVKGFYDGIVVLHGVIAHGRGEAIDYILGEKTTQQAKKAIEAAAALLLTSDRPVISVNGNAAALAGEELIQLAKASNSKLEVNLFHKSREREKKIRDYLLSLGADEVLLPDEEVIEGISSNRRYVSKHGIAVADTVLVAIEDGDRTENLVRAGKKVIAIDLNPLSRTARKATITIVDNITRAVPLLTEKCIEYRNLEKTELRRIVENFNNEENLKNMISLITKNLNRLSTIDNL